MLVVVTLVLLAQIFLMLFVEILVIFPDLHVGGLSGWDVPGAFPSLQYLWVTTVEGSLPALSGSNGSVGHTPFPYMTLLRLESDSMTGTLPPEWGSPIAFQSLTKLQFEHLWSLRTLASILGCCRFLPTAQHPANYQNQHFWVFANILASSSLVSRPGQSAVA